MNTVQYCNLWYSLKIRFVHTNPSGICECPFTPSAVGLHWVAFSCVVSLQYGLLLCAQFKPLHCGGERSKKNMHAILIFSAAQGNPLPSTAVLIAHHAGRWTLEAYCFDHKLGLKLGLFTQLSFLPFAMDKL